MKNLVYIFGLYLAVLLTGCTGGKYLEMTRSGEQAYREGNYQASLETSESIIDELEGKGKTASGDVYTLAGISAWELGEYGKSLDYLQKAEGQGYAGEQMYLGLARNYRHIDNLSREITALENYLDKYPGGTEVGGVRARLFQTCVESENIELAGQLWEQMDSTAKEDVENLETYLAVNAMQGNTSLCDSIATVILKKDRNSEAALSWSAEFYFWRAENEYQSQMKAYKKNRTHKQYAILLKAFKQVNADFKISRDRFLKLYRLYPNPEYADYLANIYTRLEDEEKARYYRSRASRD
jgi:tetratricopeptide (TPR) repeat protein